MNPTVAQIISGEFEVASITVMVATQNRVLFRIGNDKPMVACNSDAREFNAWAGSVGLKYELLDDPGTSEGWPPDDDYDAGGDYGDGDSGADFA